MGVIVTQATALLNAKFFAPDTGFLGGHDLCLIMDQGVIAYVGPRDTAPLDTATTTVDCAGRLVTPALIDCHTHIVHGGERSLEFQMRLEGRSYADIARAGGGIVSTVGATRSMSVDDLVQSALPRLDHLLAEGVATVEVKSGYGLSIDAELNMLRAARRLAQIRPVRITTSYLAAHAVAPEFKDNRQRYIEQVVIAGMKRGHAEGLIDAVDGFCESIAFSPDEIAQVFEAARALGLPVKLHAEQLSDLGGAALAASYGALSADHLEYLSDNDAAKLAEAGTVAVLLPGAFYTLREKQAPPVQALRDAGCKIALATDCNPGSSPLTSLLLTMNMGATLFGLTVPECLAATTGNAATALGLGDHTGSLVEGLSGDIAIWDAATPAELVYRIGYNPLWRRYFKGQETQA